MNTGRQIIIWVVVIALVAIGAAWWLARERADLGPAAVGGLNGPGGGGEAGTPRANVVVDDQFPGSIVYVTSADVGQGTWVSIYTDAAGQPGRLIGAGFFDTTTRVGQVTLNESTIENQNYHAVLFVDNGDVRFSPTQDTPLRTAAGEPVVIDFLVTRDLPGDKG